VEYYVNENTFKERLQLYFIRNQRSSKIFAYLLPMRSANIAGHLYLLIIVLKTVFKKPGFSGNYNSLLILLMLINQQFILLYSFHSFFSVGRLNESEIMDDITTLSGTF